MKQWQEGNGNRYAEKERMANLEVLRCVAMMMVVVLHYLGKGGTVAGSDGAFIGAGYGSLAGSILHCSCECVYDDQRILFMRKLFKLSRLLTHCGCSWLYSVGIGVAVVTGSFPRRKSALTII